MKVSIARYLERSEARPFQVLDLEIELAKRLSKARAGSRELFSLPIR